MRKNIRHVVLFLLAASIMLCACGKEQKQQEMSEDDLRAAIMGVQHEGEYVKILKNGTIDDGAWTTDIAEVELESWEAGYGRSSMSFDIPCIVFKFHIKNTTANTIQVWDVLSLSYVVDGEVQSTKEHNPLAEKYSADVFSSTEIPAGAGVTYYSYVEVNPEEAHSVEMTNKIDGKVFTLSYEP